MNRYTRVSAVAATLCLAGSVGSARADEGMWTFDNVPAAKIKETYGFEPTNSWLDQVRLSSARLAGGCSGSFVSGNGLVMTNHHCAHDCIEQLSTKKRDYIEAGFLAKAGKDEVKCPAMEVNQLTDISDVTARLNKATEGKADQAYNEALKAEMSKVEKECATGDDVRCDVVTLYRGGQYHLYKYRRFQDVRLVFAPELGIAFFGGDPDNFNFPRYDLDVSFVRVYEGGKPAQTPNHFKWSAVGAKDGDLTFVTGHPGSTSRLYTVAQMAYERDVALPRRLMRLAELRGMLNEFANRGKEQARTGKSLLFGVENSFKALKGEYEALLEAEFFEAKVAQEKALRDKLAADAAKQKKYGGAFDALAAAMKDLKQVQAQLTYVEYGAGFLSDLYGHAKALVRATAEVEQPNEKRLREYAEANMPAVKANLLSEAPVHEELEIATLTFSLTKLRETLGTDDPFVKEILGKESPHDVAKRVVEGSKLGDPKVRQKLFEGGAKAVAASNDPMLVLARKVDPVARKVRKDYEDRIEAVVKKNSELIAKAQFEMYGTSRYPDATFTLRLSYGAVKGYEDRGRTITPITDIAGAFARHTGADPYALPKSWLDKQSELTGTTPFNFVTTNDIIGGNSGSPVINQNAEVVGLIFDGNIQSLGGDYGFDARVNRAVAVHTAAITETLKKIYGAQHILDELQGGAGVR